MKDELGNRVKGSGFMGGLLPGKIFQGFREVDTAPVASGNK